jgi:hypothetical protein
MFTRCCNKHLGPKREPRRRKRGPLLLIVRRRAVCVSLSAPPLLFVESALTSVKAPRTASHAGTQLRNSMTAVPLACMPKSTLHKCCCWCDDMHTCMHWRRGALRPSPEVPPISLEAIPAGASKVFNHSLRGSLASPCRLQLLGLVFGAGGYECSDVQVTVTVPEALQGVHCSQAVHLLLQSGCRQ